MGRTEERNVHILLECEPPFITESEPGTECDEPSGSAKPQKDLQTSEKQTHNETLGSEQRISNRDIPFGLVNEAANSFGAGNHVEIATAPESYTRPSFPSYRGALERNTAAQGGFSSKVVEQRIPTSDHHELLDSRVDDGEDVANCLLSPEEIEVRARNWKDEDHENPAPLNTRSLMEHTGIDECAGQDLYEEHQAAQQQAVFTTASFKQDEVLFSINKAAHMEYPRVYSRGSFGHKDEGCSKELQMLDSGCSDADSDGGAPINYSYQSSETPGSNASSVTSRSTESVTSRSTESKEAFPPAAGIAATGHRKPELLPLPGKLTQQTQI